MTVYAERMSDIWRDGEVLDINQEMTELTLGIICKTVLNYDITSEAQQVGKALTTCRNYSKRLQNPIGQVLIRCLYCPRLEVLVKQ